MENDSFWGKTIVFLKTTKVPLKLTTVLGRNTVFLGNTIVLFPKTVVVLKKLLSKTIVFRKLLLFSRNYRKLQFFSRNYSFCDRNYSFQPKPIVYFCKFALNFKHITQHGKINLKHLYLLHRLGIKTTVTNISNLWRQKYHYK